MRRRPTVAGTIVFVVFAALGAVMAGVGAREWWLQRRALAAAVPVEATVTRSAVRCSRSADTDRRTLRDDSTTTYEPEVEFEYEVGGVRHTSDMLRPNVIVTTSPSRAAAEEALRPFPVGARVTARYDPRRPERAFLVAEPTAGPLVFVLVGLLLVPAAWFAAQLV